MPPPDQSGLGIDVRLEMLVGRVADRLAEAHQLIKTLKHKQNAVATRRQTAAALEYVGGIYNELRGIREELEELRNARTDTGRD